jgi:hypothetical protein
MEGLREPGLLPRRGRDDRLRRSAGPPLLRGLDGKASFENFEAQVEVRARAGANSGFYFHTAYQEEGWPAQGFEVQVDNSQKEHDGYHENKLTGSLYGIRNVYKAMAKDDEWFTLGSPSRSRGSSSG